ncbi:alpha/beta hydrolase family protein [Streptomyces sp. NPDC058701]|uniref:alpha/beta hydrolase family protein n=1 Tax=Streptomyces sp. NPDC058701 TaxID=3346608 RepID=UPI00364EE551
MSTTPPLRLSSVPHRLPRPETAATWASAISARDVALEDGIPGWVELVEGPSGLDVWWDEPRPLESGRRCVVRRGLDGTVTDVMPPGYNARSRLHEYGGRPWRPAELDGSPYIVFVNWADQRLYLHAPGPSGAPRPLTALREGARSVRYGDLYCPPGRAEVWCVRESVGSDPLDVQRALVAIPLDATAADDDSYEHVIAVSHHFMTCMRMSPDGRHVSWIGWDHPNMPWDETHLCLASFDAATGQVGSHRVVAGGPGQSVCQAEWHDPQTLWAVTDPGGWWNLHLVPVDGRPAVPVAPREEEFGGALWKPGSVWFAPLEDGRAVAIHGTGGGRSLSVVDPDTAGVDSLALPFSDYAQTVHAHGDSIVCVGASATTPYQVVLASLSGRYQTLTPRPSMAALAPWLPRPRPQVFQRPDGLPVHANLYPPRNPDHQLPPAERPPWVIFAHGGPTGDSPMVLDLEVSYFTSRGIGVADVNYGGSVGYGRDYRERLRGGWGVVDVEDCAAVAEGLAAAGLADRSRLAIRGGSAGGWTALVSLTRAGLYAGAVAHYGITDPVTWARGTHDFESRYLDGLIGPLPARIHSYTERSPVLNAGAATGPALLMHGLDDVIVTPDQSAAFISALESHGVPHTHIQFPGEQHGWRRADTITRALEAELGFYQTLFAEPAALPENPDGHDEGGGER